MPTYEISLPSGGTYRIDHELEDLTNDEALQILSQHLQSQTPRQAMAQESADNPNVGLGRVLDELTNGIALGSTKLGSAARRMLPQAVGDALHLPTPEDVETLRGVTDDSGWASAGEVATDIGTTMVPLAKGTQLGQQVLSKVPHLPGLVRTLAPAAVAGGAVGAATHPSDAKEGAIWGAAGAAGGEALGQMFRRIVGGIFPKTPEAARLMQRDIQPTIGQASDNTLAGKVIKGLEERVANTPIIGASAQMARERPRSGEFIRAALKEALPPGKAAPDILKQTPREIADDLIAANKQAYADLFKGIKVKVDSAFKQGLSSEVAKVAQANNLSQRERYVLDKMLQSKFFSRPKTSSGFVDPYDVLYLKEELAKLGRSKDASTYFKSAVGQLSESVDNFIGGKVAPGNRATYDAVKKSYMNAQRIKAAVRSASSTGGHFTPDQLNKITTLRPASQSLRELASDASLVLENKFSPNRFASGAIPLSGPNLISSVATAGTTARPIQKALLGGYKTQQEAAEGIRKLLPALRQFMYEKAQE